MASHQEFYSTERTDSPQETADAAFARAKLLYDVKKWDRALAELQQALAAVPEHVNAHLLAGHCYLQLSRLQLARDEAREVVRLGPDLPQGYYLLALICNTQDRYREGLQAIEQAIGLRPDDGEYYAVKAMLLVNSGKEKAALQEAERALTLDPENTTAGHVRTVALLNLDRQHEASAAAARALARNPEDAVAWYHQGVQLKAEGRVGEAKYAFLQALAIAPDLRPAEEELIQVIGATHPFFALFWWLGFTIRRLPIIIMLWIVFSPVWITDEGVKTAHRHPEWAVPIYAGIALSWLLLVLCIFSRVLMRVAFRRGWIGKTASPREVKAWARRHRREQQALDHFDRGQELMRNGEWAEARRELLEALRGLPDDREIQAGLVEAMERRRDFTLWWEAIFAMMRMSTYWRFVAAFIGWVVFIAIFAAAVPNDHARDIAAWTLGGLAAGIFFSPSIFRWLLGQGWFR